MELWVPDTLIQHYEPNWVDRSPEARGRMILTDTVQSWSKAGVWRPLIGTANIDLASLSIPTQRHLASRDRFEPGLRLENNQLEIEPVKPGFYMIDGWRTALTIERVNTRGFMGTWTTVGWSQVRNGKPVGNPFGTFCALRILPADTH
jgi:hypothetical protein